MSITDVHSYFIVIFFFISPDIVSIWRDVVSPAAVDDAMLLGQP